MTDDLENEAVASSDNSAAALFSGNELREDSSETTSSESESAENANESESAENEPKAEDKPDVEQKSGDEPEKIVMTKAEKDAEAMRIREIEQRKAKRIAEQEVGARYEQEIAKIKQQQPVNQGYAPAAPSPNHVWVPELNQWIDPSMTIEDFMQTPAQAQPQYNQQPIPQQQATVAPQNQVKQPQFSEAAYSQADECTVRIKDFKEVITGAPISPEMVNAATSDSNGFQNLYAMAKDAPHELYKILQLPVKEQERRMWMMNQKFADEKAEKLTSKAKPQPAPLNNTGEVSKDESGMSVSELKHKLHKQYWDEGA